MCNSPGMVPAAHATFARLPRTLHGTDHLHVGGQGRIAGGGCLDGSRRARPVGPECGIGAGKAVALQPLGQRGQRHFGIGHQMHRAVAVAS